VSDNDQIPKIPITGWIMIRPSIRQDVPQLVKEKDASDYDVAFHVKNVVENMDDDLFDKILKLYEGS
jgi:hypothetical protein